ncbi:Hsp20/alpha crystallin family protein [candidate division KSB1 bacterium]|nr:Hsp20/alpha crystallin family protein [candidate division KSB1 bacterium]NIR72008.1 Hsp20/alpha crystallin family protein [candidate division KSB1 bacterium]NIS25001.1 Hsp20/alpha crystallin family protein [candidate division KSB1 bacterium]NIT71917.1 Hsp20/alpha crystallin family protein [candidate division KSB1 bacterium]NIU25656.1 Hsp20/alpha crystallin family protein [candidate division KSB1 bacterium]
MFVTRWNPNRDFLHLTEQMNRLANDVFGEGETPETSMLKGTWNPPVDISEDNENFYLRVELPGLNREDIKVNYEDGLLTLTGEKRAHKEEKDTNYHRIERSYGKFERSFRLSSNIVNDKISANFSNGLLSITLPKAEKAKPKEIEVKVK